MSRRHRNRIGQAQARAIHAANGMHPAAYVLCVTVGAITFTYLAIFMWGLFHGMLIG